jgi:hypothetical protein
MTRPAVVLGLLLLGCAGPERAPMRLIRCAPGRPEPCGAVRVSLSARDAALLVGDSTVGDGGGWQVRWSAARTAEADGAPVAAPGPGRVMILVDVSGSMKGAKIGAARLVLRQFLRALDSLPVGPVKVAIAPFGSVDVARRIGAAAFDEPEAAAAALQRIPAPATENTALFSAIVLASHRLRDEVRKAGSGAVGTLVVITDGNNEVRPTDDAGLLAGDAGLAAAAAAVAEAGTATGILGIGNLDRAALERLAGPFGSVFPLPANPDAYELAGPLRRIAAALETRWLVTFRHPAGSRSALGRGWDGLEIGRDGPDGFRPLARAAWRPPFVALPAFAAAAPRHAALGGSPKGDLLGPALIVGVLLIILLEVWVLLPRLLWPAGGIAPVTGPPATPAAVPIVAAPPSHAATAARVTLGRPVTQTGAGAPVVRPDAAEAPPRRANDVTASRARRAERRP